jgi:predicted  nucleic acid-binding Zn-ribbon protein
MNRPLDTVVELQKTLDRLRDARERIEGIPDWMRELHEQHAAKKAEIDAFQAEIALAGAARRAAEAQVQDHEERLKTLQSQISQVRNQREYGALLHEIDAAKHQIKTLQDGALAALEKQEAGRQGLEGVDGAFRELNEKYSAELAKWEAEKPAVAEQIDELQKTAAMLRERLPRDVAHQFDRIYDRYGGRALSEVQGVERVGKQPQIWSCSTCNYRVRPQSVVEITNHGKIVTCDSCKRILYLGEALV